MAMAVFTCGSENSKFETRNSKKMESSQKREVEGMSSKFGVAIGMLI